MLPMSLCPLHYEYQQQAEESFVFNIPTLCFENILLLSEKNAVQITTNAVNVKFEIVDVK